MSALLLALLPALLPSPLPWPWPSRSRAPCRRPTDRRSTWVKTTMRMTKSRLGQGYWPSIATGRVASGGGSTQPRCFPPTPTPPSIRTAPTRPLRPTRPTRPLRPTPANRLPPQQRRPKSRRRPANRLPSSGAGCWKCKPTPFIDWRSTAPAAQPFAWTAKPCCDSPRHSPAGSSASLCRLRFNAMRWKSTTKRRRAMLGPPPTLPPPTLPPRPKSRRLPPAASDSTGPAISFRSNRSPPGISNTNARPTPSRSPTRRSSNAATNCCKPYAARPATRWQQHPPLPQFNETAHPKCSPHLVSNGSKD